MWIKKHKVVHYGCSSFIFTKTFSILRNILRWYLKIFVHALFCVFQTNLNKAVNIFCTHSVHLPLSAGGGELNISRNFQKRGP